MLFLTRARSFRASSSAALLIVMLLLAGCGPASPTPAINTQTPVTLPTQEPTRMPVSPTETQTLQEPAGEPAETAAPVEPVSDPGPPAEDLVYEDELAAGWQSWSWDTDLDLTSGEPVYSGGAAMAAAIKGAWAALYLHADQAVPAESYEAVRFWIHGGDGGQKIAFKVIDGNDGNWESQVVIVPKPGAWTEFVIPLASLGSPQSISGLVWQDGAGTPQPAFSVDHVALVQRRAGVAGQADLVVYEDSLADGWVSWSWETELDLVSSSPVQSGSAAMSAVINGAWAAVYLHVDPMVFTAGYPAVRFWIHGGSTGGQKIAFKVIDGNDGNWESQVEIVPQASTWTEFIVPLASLGSPAHISGLVWQDIAGSSQPAFSVDRVALVRNTSPTVNNENPLPGPELSVDLQADRRPISPYIYGMNFGDEALAAELRLPVRRWGGNATTRYNWKIDVHNTGSDWFFENIAEENPAPENLPDGSVVDRIIEQDRRTGTESIITIPLIGWTPNRRVTQHPFDCGFKVSKYGGQQSTDPYDPDCGNGVNPAGQNLTGNSPTDTSLAINPAFVEDWLAHLTGKYGLAAEGGVRFYSLDNEPMLWPYTHRDVHPDLTTYDELRDQTYAYAAAVKKIDPGAQTLGPVVWGWCAYFYSAADNCQPGPDYRSHGSVGLVEWYLQQMRAYEEQHGQRILDYLDLHMYPQAQGIYGEDYSPEIQELRLRSTRSLWDPTYTDESWIGQPIALIPRMREWVDENYPGTKLAISEYSWGAFGHLNGALAQADILGIFGREGLDLATLWAAPAADQPLAFAFRMYRNYDGQGGAFGETSLKATSADQEKLAVYAAQRAQDGALTIMVINKTRDAQTADLSIANLPAAAAAQVYHYGADDSSAIVRQSDLDVARDGLTTTFPAYSITLLVVPVQ